MSQLRKKEGATILTVLHEPNLGGMETGRNAQSRKTHVLKLNILIWIVYIFLAIILVYYSKNEQILDVQGMVNV